MTNTPNLDKLMMSDEQRQIAHKICPLAVDCDDCIKSFAMPCKDLESAAIANAVVRLEKLHYFNHREIVVIDKLFRMKSEEFCPACALLAEARKVVGE